MHTQITHSDIPLEVTHRPAMVLWERLSGFRDLGMIQNLGEAETKVLLALTLRANWTTCECWPSIPGIMRDSGLSHGAVCQSLKTLKEKHRLLNIGKKTMQCGDGRLRPRNVYEIRTPSNVVDGVNSTRSTTVDASASVDRSIGETSRRPVEGDHGVHVCGRKRISGTHQNNTTNDVAGDGGALLQQQGFPADEAQELAATTTPEHVRDMISNADHIEKTKGFRVGRRAYLRTAIKKGYDVLAPVSKRRAAQARAAKLVECAQNPATAAKAAAPLEIDLQERREYLARVSALSDEDIRDYKGELCAQPQFSDDFNRRRINTKERTNPWLIQRIVDLMIEEDTAVSMPS